MTLLAEATRKLADILPMDFMTGTSTGGSTTTLIDTGIFNPEADDYWNWGTIWFLSGNNADKSAVLSDWAQTSKTFTFPTQAAACAAGNLYAAAHKEFPRYELIRAIQKALETIGEVPQVYTNAAFVTVAIQEAYDLPAGVYNVKRVEIAESASTPYLYVPNYNCQEIDGQIRFQTGKEPQVADLLIRLTYVGAHAAVLDDDDEISDYIHIDRLIWTAAVHALRWKVDRTEGEKPILAARLNEAITQQAILEQRRKMPTVQPAPVLSRW